MTRVSILDRALAVAGLVVLSPVFVGAAVAVKLSSRGPVLHRARRVGQHGSLFTLYKFRTMREGAADTGPGITGSGDVRVTAVGRVLRASKLDELPQLLNVVRGEMSLVGPRPEDPRFTAFYTSQQRRVLDVPPGITSLASVEFCDEEARLAAAVVAGSSLDEAYATVMNQKLAIELDYLDHRTRLRDWKIIARTAFALARRDR